MTEPFERFVQETARRLPYPPTPPLRRRIAKPSPNLRLRYALLVLSLAIVCSLAVPELRAAVVKILQIGQVTIYPEIYVAEGEPLNLSAVAGETTLADAQAQISASLLSSPEQPPDRVFVQEETLLIQVWLNADQVERALYQISGFDWGLLKLAGTITGTQVRDRDAYWIDLPHTVQIMRDGDLQVEPIQFVSAPVLIWQEDGLTFRLESNSSLEDTLSFANALVLMD